MIKKIFDYLENMREGGKVEADERNDAIVLKIVKREKTIAYLSTENDGKIFTLNYTDEFLKSGVPPFNMKLSEKHKIEIGITYKSPVLWYAFASRIPGPSRPDFKKALERAGLTGNEPVLELIGKMARTSISRSWIVEIDEAA